MIRKFKRAAKTSNRKFRRRLNRLRWTHHQVIRANLRDV